MPTENQFVAAIEEKNAALLELALVQRVIYPIAADEDPEDFVALEDGAMPLGIVWNGIFFWLDPDDATSVHDGTTVVVTSDGKRYLASDYQYPFSILAAGEETTPGSPALGDSYQIGAAPTGLWSSNAGDITTYTSRGWVFETPPTGRKFYNEADGRFWFQDENGDFIEQTVAVSNNTVTPESLIGGKRFYVVESQTVNTPPGSPSLGVMWIVGSSPTGAWSGKAGQIARSDDGSTFVFIVPTEGDHAYDKALNSLYRYDSGWVNAAGAYVAQTSAASTSSADITTDGSGSGSSGYVYSDTSAPTSTGDHTATETLTVTHTARASGTIIEIDYIARLTITSSNLDDLDSLTVALFRDSETSAIDWQLVSGDVNTAATFDAMVNVKFRFAANDAASHTYKVIFKARSEDVGAHSVTFTVARRRMFLREAA